MASLHARAGGVVLLALSVGALAILACSKSSDDGDTTDPNAEGGAGAAEALFRVVEHDLVVRCGGPNGSCHVRGTEAPHWLGDPDPYLSAKQYPGILPATNDPSDSTILTQVVHTGPSLKSYPELYDHVASWVAAELPKPPLPNSGAFTVATGLNVISLDNVGPGLTGAKIQFLASDGVTGTLSLTAIRVFAPQNANLKFTSPFFVTLPRNGKVKAEPTVNGFQGDLSVPAGTNVDFYTGKMILTSWDSNGQLKIAFTKLESTPGKGANPQCVALDAFKNQALVAMRMPINITGDDDNDGGTFDGSVIGMGSCLGCHGKATPPDMAPTTAVASLDLTAADSDPAVACGFAKQFVNFQDKSMSLIILNPTGKGNPNHPIMPLADTDPVITGIKAWVTAEQQ